MPWASNYKAQLLLGRINLEIYKSYILVELIFKFVNYKLMMNPRVQIIDPT